MAAQYSLLVFPVLLAFLFVGFPVAFSMMATAAIFGIWTFGGAFVAFSFGAFVGVTARMAALRPFTVAGSSSPMTQARAFRKSSDSSRSSDFAATSRLTMR